MEAMKDLAAAVQLCFAVFSLPADLHRSDVAFVGDIGSQLQPILLRLQKAALQCEAVTSDQQLLAATASVHAALQGLQEAAGRCRVRHWLLRVLAAKDVRLQLTEAAAAMAEALQQLNTAAANSMVAADLPESHLQSLEQLQHSVTNHKVAKHDTLEALARGLLKHITDQRLDEEQLPSMLKFVVKQAAVQTQQKAHTVDSSDGAASSSLGLYSGASSSKGAYNRIPAGESSLTDTELLMVLEQMAASSADQEQIALYQILSTVEGLQEAKRHEQREHHRRKLQRRQQLQQQSLPRVSESGDTTAEAGSSSSAGHGVAPASQTTTSSDVVAGVCSTSTSGAAGGETDGEINISEVVNAMMSQLEEMLWHDPWDAAALTQVLELLLQVEGITEDSSEVHGSKEQQHQAKQLGNVRCAQYSKDHATHQGGKRGKLWSIGAAAKAALHSRLATGSNNSRGAVAAVRSKPGQQPALTAAQAKQKAAWAERIRMLATAALDVLLHLTPRPATMSSFFKASSRAGTCTETGRSLALPLMVHADTVPALSACLCSDLPDVASKAAQLLTILIQSGSAVATTGVVSGLKDGAAATYLCFCKSVCHATDAAATISIGARDGSVWAGLAVQIHNNNDASACAAAEAQAAIASITVVEDMCSSLTTPQQLRALLLLLSRYKVHSGAGGAAAAALHALSDKTMRPALHQALANNFWQKLPQLELQSGVSTVESMGELLTQMIGCNDTLSAARAAQLSASLASAVAWEGRAVAWVAMFRAAQRLLATSDNINCGNDGSNCKNEKELISSSVVRTYGAQLLVQMMGSTDGSMGVVALDTASLQGRQQQYSVSPMLAAGLDPVDRNDMLFECLQMCVLQFSQSGNWQSFEDPPEHQQVCSNIFVVNEGWAAVRLLNTLLYWLPDDAMCAVPDMYAVVLPVLEHLSATQHGAMLWQARHAQELLLGVVPESG